MQVVKKNGMTFKQWTSGAALTAISMAAPAYGAEAEALMKGLSGVEVKGYVEAQYNYNLNDPVTQTNAFRVFDTAANAFTFNMAELSLMKSSDAGTGFGLVLNYGLDADLIASAPVFTTSTVSDFNVQQAFITQKTLGGSTELKFGKYATLAGAEVIKGPNNFNISRSYLFGWTIPFTHTGVRAAMPLGPVSAVLGINNGWDLMSDNNKGKTIEAQIGLTPMEMLSAYITGYYGPEVTAGTDSDARGVVDIVATLKPMDGLAIVFNYDRGSQAAAGGAGTGSALWQGYALYANLGLGEKHAVTLRGEVFDDADGFRTGVTGGQTLRELTLTLSSKVVENLEWRAEVRHDESNVDVFVDDEGVAKDTENTVAVAAYYTF